MDEIDQVVLRGMKDQKLYLYKEGKEPGMVDVDEFARFQTLASSGKSYNLSPKSKSVNSKFASGMGSPNATITPKERVQLPQIRVVQEDSADKAVKKAMKSNLETAQNRMQLILSKYDQIEVDAKLKLEELDAEIAKIKDLEKLELKKGN